MFQKGFDKFKKDISSMLGTKVTNHKSFNIWRVCWTVVSPMVLIGIVIFSWIGFKNLETENYVFPYWSNVLGNILSVSSLSGVVLWAIFSVFDAFFINKRVQFTYLTSLKF